MWPNTALEATPHSHCGFASEFSDYLKLRVRRWLSFCPLGCIARA
jgi:hypothetical protein